LEEEPSIDIAVFREPRECSESTEGCDWMSLGVGAVTEFGDVHWCCWGEALELDICASVSQQRGKGHLIVNHTIFQGQIRSMTVPTEIGKKINLKTTKLEEEVTGKYVIVFSNCNPEGRNLTVSGNYALMSEHGYLPGNLFGELYYFVFLSIVYLLLFLWYGISMKFYQDSIIPIQRWILTTIAIGFLECFFKAGDLWVWNVDGVRFWFAMYTGVLLGVAKRSIMRCLAVMISLGWGVVRDHLTQMKSIILLGSLYVVLSSADDLCEIYYRVIENETVGRTNEEERLFDVITTLTFVVATIDVTFYMWMLDALGGTMQYLENLCQHEKLLRYLRLRLVLILSVVFAVIWAVFGVVNTYMEGQILPAEQEWIIKAVWQLNYLLVLIPVSILWKPNAKAKDYAFVMQLPSEANDGQLELVQTNADVYEEDEKQQQEDDLEELQFSLDNIDKKKIMR